MKYRLWGRLKPFILKTTAKDRHFSFFFLAPLFFSFRGKAESYHSCPFQLPWMTAAESGFSWRSSPPMSFPSHALYYSPQRLKPTPDTVSRVSPAPTIAHAGGAYREHPEGLDCAPKKPSFWEPWIEANQERHKAGCPSMPLSRPAGTLPLLFFFSRPIILHSERRNRKRA